MRNFFAKHQKVIIQYVLPILGALIVVFVLWFVVGSGTEAKNEVSLGDASSSEASEGLSQSQEEAGDVAVYVAGGVKNPGVYRLSSGALVADAIQAAGGFSKESDQSSIEKSLNLAQPIGEGLKIYIPRKGDESASSDSYQGSSSSGDSSGKVSINNASQSELMDLYGIGEVYSQKIIDGRPYSSVEELVSKEVIPNATYEKIKEEISI